jgi:DedD protein
MESRAKQRLTGAIIVVALFVLLVPELLTGPRDAHPTEAPGDEGLRRYTIDLEAQNGSGQTSPAASPEAPVHLPPVVTPQPSATNPATSTSRATAPVTPLPAPAVAPAVTAPAPTVRSVPTDSAPSQKPAERPAPAVPRGNFVVQLGSFGSRDNAERLVRDMTAKGFSAFIAPTTTNGRDLYRVRVGPTRDRASAEALATQLKRVGQSGSIVPTS